MKILSKACNLLQAAVYVWRMAANHKAKLAKPCLRSSYPGEEQRPKLRKSPMKQNQNFTQASQDNIFFNFFLQIGKRISQTAGPTRNIFVLAAILPPLFSNFRKFRVRSDSNSSDVPRAVPNWMLARITTPQTHFALCFGSLWKSTLFCFELQQLETPPAKR